MSYKPSPTQLELLRAVNAGHVVRTVIGPYKDTETGKTYSWTTMRRLLVEDLVRAPARYGDLFETTDAGRRVMLANLGGAL